MRSEMQGPAVIYYRDAKKSVFHKSQMLSFDVNHDGNWHEYEIPFTPTGRLLGLRIDPGQAVGTFEFERIQLCRKYGEILKEWNFNILCSEI